MKVRVQLHVYATLKTLLPEGGGTHEIEPGTSVRDLLVRLGIPEESTKLIFVNGIKTDASTPLQGGERVGVFPPVGGG